MRLRNLKSRILKENLQQNKATQRESRHIYQATQVAKIDKTSVLRVNLSKIVCLLRQMLNEEIKNKIIVDIKVFTFY